MTARSFVLMTDSHSPSLIRPGESGEASLTFLHLRRFQLQQLLSALEVSLFFSLPSSDTKETFILLLAFL